MLQRPRLALGTTDGFGFISGGVFVSLPNFYGKVADSVTTTDSYGISVPLVIEVREPALST